MTIIWWLLAPIILFEWTSSSVHEQRRSAFTLAPLEKPQPQVHHAEGIILSIFTNQYGTGTNQSEQVSDYQHWFRWTGASQLYLGPTCCDHVFSFHWRDRIQYPIQDNRMPPYAHGSQRGEILPSRGLLAMPGNIFGCGRVQPSPSGRGLGSCWLSYNTQGNKEFSGPKCQ